MAWLGRSATGGEPRPAFEGTRELPDQESTAPGGQGEVTGLVVLAHEREAA